VVHQRPEAVDQFVVGRRASPEDASQARRQRVASGHACEHRADRRQQQLLQQHRPMRFREQAAIEEGHAAQSRPLAVRACRASNSCATLSP
jgi:hypothetical protein